MTYLEAVMTILHIVDGIAQEGNTATADRIAQEMHFEVLRDLTPYENRAIALITAIGDLNLVDTEVDETSENFLKIVLRLQIHALDRLVAELPE